MEGNRLLAEWLNLCDGCERAGDQLEASEKDDVSRRHCRRQLMRCVVSSLRCVYLLREPLTGEESDVLQRAYTEISKMLYRNPPSPEATGERRGR